MAIWLSFLGSISGTLIGFLVWSGFVDLRRSTSSDVIYPVFTRTRAFELSFLVLLFGGIVPDLVGIFLGRSVFGTHALKKQKAQLATTHSPKFPAPALHWWPQPHVFPIVAAISVMGILLWLMIRWGIKPKNLRQRAQPGILVRQWWFFLIGGPIVVGWEIIAAVHYIELHTVISLMIAPTAFAVIGLWLSLGDFRTALMTYALPRFREMTVKIGASDPFKLNHALVLEKNSTYLVIADYPRGNLNEEPNVHFLPVGQDTVELYNVSQSQLANKKRRRRNIVVRLAKFCVGVRKRRGQRTSGPPSNAP